MASNSFLASKSCPSYENHGLERIGVMLLPEAPYISWANPGLANQFPSAITTHPTYPASDRWWWQRMLCVLATMLRSNKSGTAANLRRNPGGSDLVGQPWGPLRRPPWQAQGSHCRRAGPCHGDSSHQGAKDLPKRRHDLLIQIFKQNGSWFGFGAVCW